METKKKYATIDFNGMTFRDISSNLKKEGYSIGPYRVRTQMLRSLKGIIREISTQNNISITERKIHEIVTDENFQNNIAPFIEDSYML